jgi:O-acetylhomoserine (thiol)-lyase
MLRPRPLTPETLALHAGSGPDPATGARAVPIYQTTSYVFDDVDGAAGLFNLDLPGHIYSRISNPTVAAFEERVAALEGGAGAVATASGQAALWLAVASLCNSGDHLVASRALYGGTHQVLALTYPRFGIETTFVPAGDLNATAAAIRPNTKAVICETIGNPRGNVADLSGLADVAHRHGIPLIVDNTFATPVLCRPFDHGADLVWHSATKFIGGHGTAIGGVLVDSGTFDWEASSRFPTLTEPYAGYHGLRYVEEFGPLALLMRARSEGLRDFGACLSPQNAFLFLQGLETLPVRMPRHVANALEVAAFLEAHDAVSWVSHPGLPSHPDHGLAQKYLQYGAGAIFSFGIKGGRQAGAKLIAALDLWSHVANVGDAKSLVIHPASTTHAQLSAAELDAAGVGEELIRLSVGLEGAADLVADLGQGLKASQR